MVTLFWFPSKNALPIPTSVSSLMKFYSLASSGGPFQKMNEMIFRLKVGVVTQKGSFPCLYCDSQSFVSSVLADLLLGDGEPTTQMLHVWNIYLHLVIGSNVYIVNVGKYFIHGTYGLEYVPSTTIITTRWFSS